MFDRDRAAELAATPPPGVEATGWAGLSLGERLHRLRSTDCLRSLSTETRRQVLALPGWTRYGPRSGLPPSWFDGDGLLRPELRDGQIDGPGARFALASLRLMSRARALDAVRRARWDVRVVLTLAAGLPGVLVGLVALGFLAPGRFSSGVEVAVRFGVLLIGFELSAMYFYAALARSACSCSERRTAARLARRLRTRRARRPDGSGPPSATHPEEPPAESD